MLARFLSLSLVAFSFVPVAIAQEEVPDGVAADDWTSIRAAYDAGRHAAVATEDGFEARNPGQGWHMSFDGRGFLVEPDASGWAWNCWMTAKRQTRRQLP